MKSVKTYKKVDSENKNMSFGISKMQDVYTNRNGKVDEPHRHDFYTVLIINKAKGFHKIDFNTYELSSEQIFFVAPGQVHQVIEKEKSFGFSMTFSSQFLIENSIPLTFIDSLNLFQDYGQSPPLFPSKEQFACIEEFTENIFRLFASDAKMKKLSIGSFLKLLLIECTTLCSMNTIDTELDDSGSDLIRAFKKSVDYNYKKEHSIAYYASEFFITADHLSRTIKLKIGKTAKEYIQSRIITEAKRLLYFTDLSNKEIAYELGFNEPANFSAFFKKNTQLSPLNFKKKEIKS